MRGRDGTGFDFGFSAEGLLEVEEIGAGGRACVPSVGETVFVGMVLESGTGVGRADDAAFDVEAMARYADVEIAGGEIFDLADRSIAIMVVDFWA